MQKRRRDLGINNTILRAGYEDVAFDLHEIGELGGIKLAHADGVCLFASAGEHSTDLLDHWEVLSNS